MVVRMGRCKNEAKKEKIKNREVEKTERKKGNRHTISLQISSRANLFCRSL
jgi:hypothetical protein